MQEQQQQQQQPQEQQPQEQPQEQLLPSEMEQLQQEQEVQQKELSDLAKGLDQFVKDGLIDGKFKSVEDLIQSYRDLEAKYANTRREITETQKQKQTEAQKQEEQLQLQQKQQEVINDLLPKFLENGLQLTEDMVEKAKEVGIDEKDLKLSAYELKEATQKAYSVVGGEQNYKEMLEWAKENLSKERKIDFDRALTSDFSEFAIKGLWAEYQSATANGGYRVQGKPASSGLRPYSSRQELYKDKAAAEAAKRRGDPTLWNRYRQRLAITPPEAIGV